MPSAPGSDSLAMVYIVKGMLERCFGCIVKELLRKTRIGFSSIRGNAILICEGTKYYCEGMKYLFQGNEIK